jgi:hypothetical protein
MSVARALIRMARNVDPNTEKPRRTLRTNTAISKARE